MAGRICDDDIAKVREATDLVALVGERTQVKPKGREFWCCCPLHQEKTPSFKMDPATQLWHCFGCGEGGDVFGFVMKADDLTFPEAVRKLAERAHIELEEDEWNGVRSSGKQRLKEVCKATAEFYHTRLMRSPDEGSAKARSYLAAREMGGNIPKTWNLGYAPGHMSLITHLTSSGFTAEEMIQANVAITGRDGRLRDRFFDRVMFPINDVQGNVVAFGGRVLGDGEPKYLNSQETPLFHKAQVLYGLDKAKAAMTATGTAIVTEGYTDVIAMHKAGLQNAVATLGTALTKNHIRLLSRHAGRRIVYIFDGDAAGQRATERALQFIDESITPESNRKPMDICALCLPDGQDPAEYLGSHSADDMRSLIAAAQPLILFGIERRLARHDRGTAEGRAGALSDALDVLAPIKDSILAKDYAVQIASMLGLREDDVLEQLKRTKPARRYDDESTNEPGSMKASAATGGKTRQTPRLSVAERNRLALEREFLGTVAQNPTESLACADSLQHIRWHESAHLDIASSIVDTLMEKLDATPAEIIEAASRVVPNASGILTGTQVRGDVVVSTLLRYLSEELEIGDVEEELALAKRKSTLESDEQDASSAYAQVVALQDRLSTMRKAHTPLP